MSRFGRSLVAAASEFLLVGMTVMVSATPGTGVSGTILATATLHLPAANLLTVYDAKGNTVGTTIQHDMTRAMVPFRVGTTPVTLVVFRNGLQHGGGNELEGTYWDSPDCSGQPFIGANNYWEESSLMPRTTVAGPGWTVYVADTTKRRRMLAQSQWFSPGPSKESFGRCEKMDSVIEVFPAKALTDLSTMFTPPFSIR